MELPGKESLQASRTESPSSIAIDGSVLPGDGFLKSGPVIDTVRKAVDGATDCELNSLNWSLEIVRKGEFPR